MQLLNLNNNENCSGKIKMKKNRATVCGFSCVIFALHQHAAHWYSKQCMYSWNQIPPLIKSDWSQETHLRCIGINRNLSRVGNFQPDHLQQMLILDVNRAIDSFNSDSSVYKHAAFLQNQIYTYTWRPYDCQSTAQQCTDASDFVIHLDKNSCLKSISVHTSHTGSFSEWDTSHPLR